MSTVGETAPTSGGSITSEWTCPPWSSSQDPTALCTPVRTPRLAAVVRRLVMSPTTAEVPDPGARGPIHQAFSSGPGL
ncbi:unnamed protein product [Pleuronectes platessa]|uniref:Uncharacterized protein n=1 Tax=Pleuronectes platessa TaxID=8262 RepID=A0A9N7VR27_PLEPL|nr:unnamed protein product [Pleuronectes platessa]